jgi:hypothetical protein
LREADPFGAEGYPERCLIARSDEVTVGATRIVQRIIVVNVEFAEKSAK